MNNNDEMGNAKAKSGSELKSFVTEKLIESKRGFMITDLKTAEGFKVILTNFGLNYIIEFFEGSGWGIYIEVIDDGFYELDGLPDYDYIKICEKVDELNYHYFSDDESSKVLNEGMRKVTQYFSGFDEKILSKKSDKNQLTIEFKEIRKQKSRIIVKFSPMINYWEAEYQNIFEDDNIKTELYELFSGLEDLIYDINEYRGTNIPYLM